MSQSTTPYTYFLQWSSTGMKYYGVRYAKHCNPLDLWNPYKTSSKYVKEHVSLHGDPDIVQIRNTFITINEARLWENKVLKRISAAQRPDYLNRTDNHSISPADCGRGAKKAAPKRRGRTKLNHPGVARTAIKLTGRTKETHPCVAEQAKKLTGRTKEHHEYLHRKSISTAKQMSKTWEITTPAGEKIKVFNMCEWCRNNGFSRGSIGNGYTRKGYHFSVLSSTGEQL